MYKLSSHLPGKTSSTARSNTGRSVRWGPTTTFSDVSAASESHLKGKALKRRDRTRTQTLSPANCATHAMPMDLHHPPRRQRNGGTSQQTRQAGRGDLLEQMTRVHSIHDLDQALNSHEARKLKQGIEGTSGHSTPAQQDDDSRLLAQFISANSIEKLDQAIASPEGQRRSLSSEVNHCPYAVLLEQMTCVTTGADLDKLQTKVHEHPLSPVGPETQRFTDAPRRRRPRNTQ